MRLNLKLKDLKLVTAILAAYVALDLSLAMFVYRKNTRAVSVFFDTTSLQDKVICLSIAAVVGYSVMCCL